MESGWSITIQGTGKHSSNDAVHDADQLSAAFVAALQAAEQTVQSASFTFTGKSNLLESEGE
ncbi:MAG: hypothetical protein ACREJD_09405 [Phycisphaerales bacterium]